MLLVLTAFSSFAQKDGVIKRLHELNINTDFLEKVDDNSRYAYHGVTTSHTAAFDAKNSTVNVSVFDYDPTTSPKYTLRTYNDHQPSESELQSFNKSHNGDASGAKVDLNSLTIVSEDNNKIVIGFKVDKKALNESNKYLEDCMIDKASKRVTQASFHNTKPFSMSILKVDKMDVKQDMQYMPDTQTYVITRSETLMDVELPIKFGDAAMIAKGSELSVYSDYKKVR
jgi:hypothetical protein